MPGHPLAHLGLIYCAAIWGATFFLVKGTLDSVHPIAMVAWRFLIAATLLLPFVLKRGAVKRHIRDAVPLSAMLTALYVAQTWGLSFTTASKSGFITGLFVILVPLILRLWLKRAVTSFQWLACLLALAGLYTLTDGLSSFNAGDALTLIAAFTYATHVILTDIIVRKDADATALVFHQFWMTGLLCLLGALAFRLPLSVTHARGWYEIAFLAVFPTLSAFFVQVWAQKLIDPVRVSLIFSLEPVFAALFAWTLGGEHATKASVLGGSLILAALFASEIRIKKTVSSCHPCS